MGRDKARLSLPSDSSTTFVGHLSSLLASFCPEVLVVVRDEAEAANYALPGIHVITDKVPNCGPLMGLYSGLSEVSMQRALVIAVDMPFVQPALISFLLSQPSVDSLLVPHVGGVPQVLLSLYPRAILPSMEECLRRGRRDLRCLLEVVPVQYIEEAQLRGVDPELRSFVNVNTPEEYGIRGELDNPTTGPHNSPNCVQ